MSRIIHCEFCGKVIYSRSMKTHINIERDPPIYYFCNKKCKMNWVLHYHSNFKKMAALIQKRKKDSTGNEGV